MIDFTNIIQNLISGGYDTSQQFLTAIFPLALVVLGISAFAVIVEALMDRFVGIVEVDDIGDMSQKEYEKMVSREYLQDHQYNLNKRIFAYKMGKATPFELRRYSSNEKLVKLRSSLFGGRKEIDERPIIGRNWTQDRLNS